MANNVFSDAALMLVGHGSTQNAESCQTVYRHAAELRRRQIFAQVEECFWQQEPFVQSAFQKVSAPRVFIVPVFISEGYFTEQVIPRELGLQTNDQPISERVQRRGSQTLYYCEPIGTHQSMSRVLLARARDIVAQHPFPYAPKPAQIALVIAGHGTPRNEQSRQAIIQQVRLIRSLNLYAEVHAVFLEEEPRVGDCFRLAQARNLVLVPFFTSDGQHTRQDIPVLLGEPERRVQERLRRGQPTWRNPTERHGKRVWYTASIGSEPHIPDIILERVRERAAESVFAKS